MSYAINQSISLSNAFGLPKALTLSRLNLNETLAHFMIRFRIMRGEMRTN